MDADDRELTLFDLGAVSKRCTRCASAKAQAEFTRDLRQPYTHCGSWCRACSKAAINDWRKRNLEKCREQSRKWRTQNPAACRESKRKHRTKNDRKELVSHAKWFAAHPERVKEYHSRRRDLHRAASSRLVPAWWTKAMILDPCSYCGKRGGVIDHVVALSTGGAHADDNLAGACKSCNSRKRTIPLLMWLLRSATAAS